MSILDKILGYKKEEVVAAKSKANTAELEAQVMRDGMLVGFVPVIEGSADFDDAQIIDAIANTDYDQPIAHRAAKPPVAAPALAPEGGVFRRFLGGFRTGDS